MVWYILSLNSYTAGRKTKDSEQNGTVCSESCATHGEMQYKFYFLLLCHFHVISAENIHHYALHRDAHEESC
jgi:hypothetical protein